MPPHVPNHARQLAHLKEFLVGLTKRVHGILYRGHKNSPGGSANGVSGSIARRNAEKIEATYPCVSIILKPRESELIKVL
jgi:hypothetical protein